MSQSRLKALVTLVLVAGLLAIGMALAEPGGKEDPLITVGYARQLSAFQVRKLPTGTPLKLRSGAELVLVAPSSKPVNAAGLTDTTPLLNLSSGERVIVTALRANQHYVYAGESELSLRFDAAVTCLVRGEAK
jgi:hypothetical protein